MDVTKEISLKGTEVDKILLYLDPMRRIENIFSHLEQNNRYNKFIYNAFEILKKNEASTKAFIQEIKKHAQEHPIEKNCLLNELVPMLYFNKEFIDYLKNNYSDDARIEILNIGNILDKETAYKRFHTGLISYVEKM